jgi:hypothetical protein
MGDVVPLKPQSGRQADQSKRNAARPRLRRWFARIEVEIKGGRLLDIDGRLAQALTNYPSANEGICWPGQARLAGLLGRSDRTVRRSIGRLERAGFLHAKQQGWNRSSCYTFMIDGHPLIPSAGRLGVVLPAAPTPGSARSGEGAETPPASPAVSTYRRTPMSTCDRTSVSTCDRTSVSTYPLESSKPLESESPSTPKAPIEGAGTAASGEITATVPSGEALSGLSREESTKESTGGALVGEIISPQSISFDDFWTASGMVGEVGPAMAIWGKLQDPERAAIGDLICRNRAIDTEGMWACTWLKNRGWERPPPIARSAPGFDFEFFTTRPATLSPEDKVEQDLANGAPILSPYSNEWWAARNRYQARGKSVYVMDKLAERDKGWPAIDD